MGGRADPQAARRRSTGSVGLTEQLPVELVYGAEEGERWRRLLTEVIDLLNQTYGHGLDEPLSARQVFAMLVTRLQGVHFPKKDVARVMDFLSHPVVGALVRRDEGYMLVMSRETIGLRLRRLAEGMETARFRIELLRFDSYGLRWAGAGYETARPAPWSD